MCRIAGRESAAAQVIEQLCKVHGVGPATASEWYVRGIRTVEDALKAGVMNDQQQIGAKFWQDMEQRIPVPPLCRGGPQAVATCGIAMSPCSAR